MKYTLTYSFLLICILSFSQALEEYNISFKGDKLYLKSSYNLPDDKSCIDSIKLNHQKVRLPEKPFIYIINPDDYNIKIGDKLLIQIYHQKECSPQFIKTNQQQHKIIPKIENAFIDSIKSINWEIENETENTKYIIQHYKWNRWVTIKEIKGQLNKTINQYSYTPKFHSGVNKFKIKQLDSSKVISVSRILKYDNLGVCKPIKMFNPPSNIIEFSDSTYFELYDSEGVKIKKGFEREIDMNSFKKGIYFINYDYKTGEIIKIK